MADPMREPPGDPDGPTALRRAAAALAAHRGRPCLVFHAPEIRRPTVLAVRQALATTPGAELDLVVSSPGGDLDAAYVIARELRRRFKAVTAYVPLVAKSAATLLCLAADELVLGGLGELGPLDAQHDEKQKADFPLTLSRLAPFTALEQLQDRALALYDEAAGRILQRSGMRPFEACRQAAELTSALYRGIYAQIDPNRLAESARGLEIGCEYGARVLRRYRPDVFAKAGEHLVHRLVHGYPSHGFVIDLEELAELGLPARAAEGPEAEAVEALAAAIIDALDPTTLIELVAPPMPEQRQEDGAAEGAGSEGAGGNPATRVPAVGPLGAGAGRLNGVEAGPPPEHPHARWPTRREEATR